MWKAEPSHRKGNLRSIFLLVKVMFVSRGRCTGEAQTGSGWDCRSRSDAILTQLSRSSIRPGRRLAPALERERKAKRHPERKSEQHFQRTPCARAGQVAQW